MNLPDRLSPSSINLFQHCPYRWYCEKQNLPQIRTDDTALFYGKTIHNIIENYYSKIQDGEVNPQNPLDEALIESGNWITDKFKSRTKKFYNNFLKFEKDRIAKKIPKPELVEQKYKLKLFEDLPDIVGIVDVYMSGTVIDWKTGRDATIGSDQLIQGKIYEMLIKKQELPVKKTVFNYIILGVSPEIPNVSEAYIYSTIKNMCENIEKDYFPCKESYLCKYCGYQLRCKYKDVNGWQI